MSGGRRSGLAGSLHSFSFGVPETRECAMFGQATRLEFRTCLFPDRWPQNHVPTPRGTRAVESAQRFLWRPREGLHPGKGA